MFVTVPAAVPGAIDVLSVNTPLPAAASDAIVYEIVPPAPATLAAAARMADLSEQIRRQLVLYRQNQPYGVPRE